MAQNPHMKRIVVDANVYLGIYGMSQPIESIGAVVSVQNEVFVPEQVRLEFVRNSVKTAAAAFAGMEKRGESEPLGGCVHLLCTTDSELTSGMLDQDYIRAEHCERIGRAVATTLEAVVRGEDVVTLGLSPLFQRAKEASPLEISSARQRKEAGHPPGKVKNPLGDELVWEQFLTLVKEQARRFPEPRAYWLITSDKDYFTKHGGRTFLNAALFEEFETADDRAEIRVFDSLLEGLKDFRDRAGVAVDFKMDEGQLKGALRKDQELRTRELEHIMEELEDLREELDNRQRQLSD